MSLEDVQSVIEQALQNHDYMELLLTNPEKALKDKVLTDDEMALLSSLASSPYTSARRGLMETRKLIQVAIDSKAA